MIHHREWLKYTRSTTTKRLTWPEKLPWGGHTKRNVWCIHRAFLTFRIVVYFYTVMLCRKLEMYSVENGFELKNISEIRNIPCHFLQKASVTNFSSAAKFYLLFAVSPQLRSIWKDNLPLFTWITSLCNFENAYLFLRGGLLRYKTWGR